MWVGGLIYPCRMYYSEVVRYDVESRTVEVQCSRGQTRIERMDERDTFFAWMQRQLDARRTDTVIDHEVLCVLRCL